MGVGDMHNTGRGMERDIRIVFSMYPNSIRVSVRVRMYWSCPVSHLFTSSPRLFFPGPVQSVARESTSSNGDGTGTTLTAC